MTFPRVLTTMTTRVNHWALQRAGTRAIVDLEHVGRRSGTVHHTPLRGFRRGRTVAVGLNFGSTSDWYRNIRAAGHCRMRLGDELVELGAPRLVSVREGAAHLPWWFGWGLRHVVRSEGVVLLPVLASHPVARGGAAV